MSHTIKTFLSSKIHFLERYVLLSKIVGHKITMNSKWFLYTVSIYGFKQFKEEFGLPASSYANEHS